MPQRKLDNWLNAYLEYTDNSESPLAFHLWTAMGCIGAALQRKVYMRWGHTDIYPNQYVVLVGPSGRARKGEAITIGRSMVKTLNIPMLGEDNSPEAIIKQMDDSAGAFKDETTGNMREMSSMAGFLEELSVFTGEQNKRFLAMLTNWYDSRDDWQRRTKNKGINELAGMCFNLVAATAPDWLPLILPHEAIGGGFTSRCIFIVETQKRKIISNPNLKPPDKALRDRLIHDLEIIHTLTGEYKFTPETLEQYENWYVQEEKKIEKGEGPVNDPAFAGYISRRATHVKKLGMIIAASQHDRRELDLDSFEVALNLMEKAEVGMQKVFAGIGKARYAEESEALIEFLSERKKVTKAAILRRFNRTVDSYVLDAVTETLVAMKRVRVKIDREEGETYYVYVED